MKPRLNQAVFHGRIVFPKKGQPFVVLVDSAKLRLPSEKLLRPYRAAMLALIEAKAALEGATAPRAFQVTDSPPVRIAALKVAVGETRAQREQLLKKQKRL